MSRVLELENQIKYHKALYYQGRPEIQDHEYDKIEDELKSLDPSNLVLSIVGSAPSGSNKVKHDQKMLSLGKTYKVSELEAWNESRDMVSTVKIDGVSCSLVYIDGNLSVAKTRGDGSYGENITLKAHWIKNIPLKINEKEKLEVRGEIFCYQGDFLKLSDEMESINLDRPSSQRNIVAGLIGRKENLELCRHITFKAFEAIGAESNYTTEMEKFSYLKRLKFNLPEVILHKNFSGVDELVEKTKTFMSEGNYQIDGIVFSFNDLALHRELGETAHHPRYKMAFKYQGESKKTVLNEIIWSISRNGYLTPVGDIEPVELSGAMISRVTLHNYGMVKQNNLKSGDEIEIIRSGEVIPKFLSVVKDGGGEFTIPKNCVSCAEEVEVDDIRLVCRNRYCPGIVKESILNFIQKIGIDDLSSKRLDELLKSKLVKEISDLYKLTPEALMGLDKVKDKLANKLVGSIESSKSVDLVTFLSALGISGGAYNKCEKVVHAGFDTIEKIKNLTATKLEQVDSFAEKSSTEFVNSIQQKKELIDRLISHGFSFEKVKANKTPVSGKKICITGSLTRKRSVVESDVRDAGGLVVSSVSKTTDYLLTNDKESSSSKFKKAQALNIPIITEEDFLEMIK